jgi:vacuolar-type H+-ATPase subunit E/Vma4
MEERLQRARLLSARDEFIQRLAGEAGSRLGAAAGSNATAYSALLKGLIKQGVLRLEGEAAVEVQCRPQDLALATKLAPSVATEVAAESGGSRAVAVTVVGAPQLASSSGGVTLSAAKGTIRCDNTLEARLGLALGDLTPAIRDVLFPSARAEVRVKPAVVVNPHSLKNTLAHAALAHGSKPAAGGAAAGALAF